MRRKKPTHSMDLFRHNNSTETLPNELLEQIFTQAWLSPMFPAQRATFIKSIFGASRTWVAMLARIVAKHVYVSSSPLNCESWSNNGWAPSLWHSLSELSVQLCHSVTRQIVTSPKPISDCPSSALDRLPRTAIRELFQNFHALPYIPNLRELSIEYLDPVDVNSSLTFRFSVIHLEVEYTFPSDTPSWLVDELGLTGKTKCRKARYAPWELPDLFHISTSTTSQGHLGDVLNLLPHLQLSEKSFGIKVKVLSASQYIPHPGFLLHGPLSAACMSISSEKAGYCMTVVRGRALGVMLEAGSKGRRCQNQAVTSREVYIFKQMVC
ncbi:hypothetical protein CPB84DRAFT_1765974 [Gymnopilus junonius]|uniref:Uncharacterized protein n=1 Tax=Gymnopilus junonius TaxID=109634 RepID=A0A9P5TSR3_GYMJU|nr:hypothetical protein CPB84DRAFT_1765974 [Gymnopilus junonius]